MRQIILDTETTGLEPRQGHRIVEIGCVEMVNRRRTGQDFHQYLNPGREIDDGAFDVHGISNEFLADKPSFADIAQELIDFIRDSELIIHNAPFDIGFINAELRALGKNWGQIEDYCAITDTLIMAREKHPGQKNSLDALCARYEINNSQRELHGALLDARILLDVYLAMTGGQESLGFDLMPRQAALAETAVGLIDSNRARLAVVKPTAEEFAAHLSMLEKIKQESGGKCIFADADLEPPRSSDR